MSKIDYKKAGVDIDAGNEAVEHIKKDVKTTFTPNVLTGLGSWFFIWFKDHFRGL